MSILRRFGFYLSYNKLLTPSQCNRFLGIELDSVNLQLCLPADKLTQLKIEQSSFIGRRKATREDLEHLGGRLAHCSTVVQKRSLLLDKNI